MEQNKTLQAALQELQSAVSGKLASPAQETAAAQDINARLDKLRRRSTESAG